MNEFEDKIADGDHGRMNQADQPAVRILGYPGTFTNWGIALVRQMLEHAGYAVEVTPLEQAPSETGKLADGSPLVVRIAFGHGPVMAWPEASAPCRQCTLAFLDAPANAMADMLANLPDPSEVARMLSKTLAPLASILRQEKVLQVDRMLAADPVAMQAALAEHFAPVLPLEPVPSGVASMPAPAAQLKGQALSLTRQLLAPYADFVTGVAQGPILWPLAAFYTGDQLEQAPPVIDVAGPSRVLYYGPYVHMPRGSWRADVQMFLSRNMPDSTYGVDVVMGEEVVRRKFRPTADGLCELAVPFVVRRADEMVELRIWLLRSALDGHIGLRQVVLFPGDQ